MVSIMHGCIHNHNAEMRPEENVPRDVKPEPGVTSESVEAVPTAAALYGCLCHQPVATAEKLAPFDHLDNLITVAN